MYVNIETGYWKRLHRGLPFMKGTPLTINTFALRVISAAALIIAPMTAAHSTPIERSEPIPWIGEQAITETVAQIMEHQAGFVRSTPRPIRPRLSANRMGLRPMMDSTDETPSISSAPTDPRTTLKGRKDAPQTTGVSFNGPTVSDTLGYTPPDAMGAAGPTQFLATVNGRFRTYNKATGIADGALNADPDVFFQSVLTPGVYANGTTDPRVRFDRLTGRWFIVMIDIPTDSSNVSVNNRVLIAVSSSAVITGQTSFKFFYFQQNTVSPAGDTNMFADYPTLGLDVNALYIGANMFTGAGGFHSTTGWVVQKSSILGAGPIAVTAFRNLATMTGITPNPGVYTPQGVDNDDPTAMEGYFIGPENNDYGILVMRRVSTPGGTPTISGDLNIPVPPTSYPVSVTTLGSTCPLDASGDDRLYSAQIQRNPVNGEQTLWTAHSIGVDSNGIASSSPVMDASRWYELRNLTTTPALKQSGTLYDSTGAHRSYIYPAIAMSGQGHVALSSSTMGPSAYTGVALTGRLNGDAAGTLQPVTMVPLTSFAYNYENCTGSQPYQRWGDYGYTCVDPNDDMTMWTVQEYASATNKWGVRIVQLKAPPPALPIACSPNTLAPGAAGAILVVTGASTGGSGFFDPGAGFANRLTAGVSGSGVTVNSVTYNSPTQVTLNVTVASGTPNGQRSITITNPDGQTLTSAVGVLSIAGVPYVAGDVVNALKIAGGLLSSSSADISRYGIVTGNAVNIADATQILRKVTGLVPNP
ncbi:MAG TPA: hypothetical protein VGM51_14425 [Armatimonadota bacterium]